MDIDAQQDLSSALMARRAGQLARVELGGRNLTGAQAIGADLVGAELERTVLTHACLTGARLGRANLEGADLRYCDLAGADLTDANLRHADLTGAHLDGAVLAGADLRDVCLREIEGDPRSMMGARLNKGAITRSAFKMKDIARLVVHGAVVNEKASLPPLAPPVDQDVPASLRFLRRMNALIAEVRPSLQPRHSSRAPVPLSPPAPPPPKAELGQEFLGVVLAELLPGSTMTRTFRGTNADGVRVLVKVFDADARGADSQLPAFQRGLEALCRMQGPQGQAGRSQGVAEVLAVATDLTAYVVRQYENGSITNIADVALTMRAGLEIFRSVCETVAALHREGVLVRSFKPSNILIDGLSPVIGEIDMLDLPALATVRSDVAGYRNYVAPEELAGEGTRSPTADIYALGKLVDYLLTGHEPIAPVGGAPLVAGRKGTPPVLVDIVKRCLSSDPNDRYQHVEELLLDLQNFEMRGAQATLHASMRPGELSRLKSGSNVIPGRPSQQDAVATPEHVSAEPPRRPSVVRILQHAVGFLGIGLGALGVGLFYRSPGLFKAIGVTPMALLVATCLAIWALPAPKPPRVDPGQRSGR